jgi:hypothetical protein
VDLDLGQWRRAHRLGTINIVSAALGAVAVFFAILLVRAAVDGRIDSPVGGALAAAILVAWLMVSWRGSRLGVYTGERGVKVSTLTSTTVAAWPDIAEILELPTDPFDEQTGQRTMWLLRHSGTPVSTPVKRRGSTRALRLLSVNDYQIVLRPDVFDALVADLRSRLR